MELGCISKNLESVRLRKGVARHACCVSLPYGCIFTCKRSLRVSISLGSMVLMCENADA